MKKRIVSSLLCLCMALSLLPGTGLAAEAPEGGDGIALSAQAEESAVALADARVLSPSFRIDLADASACRYHHGSNLSTFTASDLENGNSPYDPSNGGTISVTNSGSSATFKFKERAHFKNADYLLQPFTISVDVPAYTAYTVTFDVDVSLVRNAKGSTWYFLEMVDNTDGAAYTTTYSGGENTTMYGNSYFRCFGNGSSYKPSVHVTLTFMNNTDASKAVTRDFAFLLGNSRSGSLLTSYHHQLETTVTFSATSIEPSEYVAVVDESGAGVGQMYKTLDEAVAAYNASTGTPALGLLRDVSTSSPLTLAKTGTVDLDGHTLTLSGPSAGLVAAAGATVDIIGDSTTKGALAAAGASTAISGAGAVRLSNITISGAVCGVNASGGVTLGNSVTFTGCTRDIYLKTGATITLATNALSNTAKLKVAVENIRAATYDSPVAIVSNWSAAMSSKNPATYLTVEGCQTLQVVNGALAAKPYRLTFNANGGAAAVTTADSDLAGRVSGVPNPTRAKYTFAGWYTAQTGGIQVNLTTGANLTGDFTLYAHWTADPVTVTLDPQDGILPGDDTLTATPGETYTGLPTPTRENYTFLGWYTAANGGGSKVEDGSAVTSTSSHTLYAFWQRDTVTITFDANGGSPDSSRLLDKGTALGGLPTPVRTGYTFAGWYTAETDGTQVTANDIPTASVTYYAHWTAIEYTVTLNKGNGEADTTLTVTYGGTYDGLPDVLTRDYYTFTGWYTAQTGGTRVESGTAMTRAAGHTLYARWSRDTYTVTFDANGGPEVASRPVNAGDALGTLPTPARAGYSFEGWYTAAEGGELVTATIEPKTNVTYYAHWTAITYTIPVNGTNQTITVEQPYSTILTETPTPQDGYTFSSWQDEKGNTITPNAKPNPDSIPTAINPIWTANTYTVTFNANGGMLVGSSPLIVTYGQPYGTLPTATPPTGYNFVGWKLENGTTVTAATAVATVGNHILTAQFELQHTHSVSHDGTDVVVFTNLNAVLNDSNNIRTLTGYNNEEYTYILIPAGSYYLTDNITTDKQIRIAGDATVNICFNGHTITSTYADSIIIASESSTSGSSAVSGAVAVVNGTTLNTCDCQGSGGITSGNSRVITTLGTKDVTNVHTINLYGGTFTGNASGKSTVYPGWTDTLTVDGATIKSTQSTAIYMGSSATVEIKSGTVTTSRNGTNDNDSYAIYILGPNFTMTGGTVTNTGTGTNTYGLYFPSSGSGGGTISGGTISATNGRGLLVGRDKNVTLSGSPVITSKSANIYFSQTDNNNNNGTITVGENLTGTYSVYYGGYSTTITETTPRTITTAASADYSSHFTAYSSMAGVEVRSSGEGNAQVVQLYRPHRHDGVEYTALTADSTTLTSGHYFLAENLNADLIIPAGETVDLCLNGKTLTGQITVNGTLNLWDCKDAGTVSYTSGSAISGGENSVVNYYGGTLSGGSGDNVPLYTNGIVNLYATPSITTSCDHDIRGNSEGFLGICAALTKPSTALKVDFGTDVDITNKKQVTITTGWTEAMGSTAVPADYFACRENRYAKVVKGDNGEAVLRLFQVTVDGKVCYPSYENGTLSSDDLPGEPASRPGYVWKGWYDAETGGNPFNENTALTDDLTLYPRWTKCDHEGNTDEGPQTAPTCTEPGVSKFTCSICNLAVEIVTPALGHAFSDDWSDDETNGAHYHLCTRDGCTARQDEAPHAWGEGVTQTAATCTADGSIKYTCTECGATRTETILALGHDFTAWGHDEKQHWYVCAREGCDEADTSKENHTFGDWIVTTPAQIGEKGIEAHTCTVCGYSETKEIDALEAPKYAVAYELDAYTVGTAPTQAETAEDKAITLPGSGSGLTRTGYTLAGWALLDEDGLPGKTLTGTFTMPGRDVTFQVRWTRVDNYHLQPGETLVLEDGTVIENRPDGTVAIDQDGDGSPETTVTLPGGLDDVTVQQGDGGEKDKLCIPKGTEVQTGGGPVVTLGGDGTVDVTGAVDAPTGSTVKDANGNTAAITGGSGRIDPDGVITFPEGQDGKITVEDKDGNRSEATVPGGREGAEVTPGGSVLVDDSDSTVVITTPEGPITITPPEGGDGDGASLSVDEGTGAVTIPSGSTVEDEKGGRITIGEGGGSVSPDGAVTVPPGSTVEDEKGNTTTITEGTGTVNPDGTITFPGGGKITVTDSKGQETEVTVNPGGTVAPENPTPPSGGGTSVPVYRPDVEQPAEGGSAPAVSPSAPRQGDKVTITPKPDPGYGVEDVTVTDRNGSRVEVTANPDGTYSFTQPSGKVTITVTYRETGSTCDGGVYCPSRAFADLSTTAWYHEAVDYALNNGLMSGYGDGLFGPNNALSRAQLCQILYNLEGRPAVTAGSPFTDVADTAWYAGAVTWANLSGIVGGYGGGLFGPDDPITREQLAAILYRYAQYKGYNVTQGGAAIREFSDCGSISAYAVEAMTWAVDTGVVGGYEDKTLRPRDGATRAQVAQMLMNFLRTAG